MDVEPDRPRGLEHPLRVELYAELRTAAELGFEPVIAADELTERMVEAEYEVDFPTVAYHLQVLEREHLIVLVDGGYRAKT